MGSFTPHRGTHRFISNDTPISWESSLLRGTQRSISVSERTTHPSHGHLPYTGAHNVPSPSQRGTTHPSHGHTQLMGSLTGRLTQSVSWRMSHASVIINTQHIFLADFGARPFRLETMFRLVSLLHRIWIFADSMKGQDQYSYLAYFSSKTISLSSSSCRARCWFTGVSDRSYSSI
jgi:hypothetical protein